MNSLRAYGVFVLVLTLCLISGGHPVFAKTQRSNSENAFYEAKRGDVAALKQRIGKDPSLIDARRPNGQTLLMRASYYGREGAVQLLLDRGADVNARDLSGNTALTVAPWPDSFFSAFNGSTNRLGVIKALLAAGADINAKNNFQKNYSKFYIQFM